MPKRKLQYASTNKINQETIKSMKCNGYSNSEKDLKLRKKKREKVITLLQQLCMHHLLRYSISGQWKFLLLQTPT